MPRWFSSASSSRPVISGFSSTRARIHASSLASVKGFLPPIGNAAGLPVSARRLAQRIAEEWLTW
jgi:hypothetical protein